MSTEQDVRLISLVRDRALIYNNAWKDRRCVDNLWLEISLQMRLPTELCKRKWTNLRNTYARHIREEKAGYIYDGGRKPWYLAEKMSFLKDYMHNRPNSLDDSQSSYSWSPDFSATSAGSHYFPKRAKLENGRESLSQFERLLAGPKIDSNPDNQVTCTGTIKAEPQDGSYAPEVQQINRHGSKMITSLISGESDEDNNSAEGADENRRDPSTRYFFKSIMLNYDKLSRRRRRLFQQKMLYGLHELLNEQEDDIRQSQRTGTDLYQHGREESREGLRYSSANSLTDDATPE
ncbi:uncharacterized protein LOC126840351 [Adelges cooleyi]|uniref:uncharacterized protein LOC126840351 n=1 Tax=Adelges cooleyi TaxID=133065 RepID=UPI0021807672|nr:uncharacterized protein LOC126840351 [Adelges cooleyi]